MAIASSARPDVAGYVSNSEFANTGWSQALDISHLALGDHTVTAIAIDSANASASIASLTFTIVSQDTVVNRAPIGWLDSVTNTKGSSVVHPSDTVVARGWAADWQDGAASHVTVSLDG